jgi:hypothetical protein
MAFFRVDKYIVHLTYLRSLQGEFWIDYNIYQEVTLSYVSNFVFLVLFKASHFV